MDTQAEAKAALDALVAQTTLRIDRLQANLDGLEIPTPVPYEIHPAEQLRQVTRRVETLSQSLGAPLSDDPMAKAYRVGLETEVKVLQEVKKALQADADQLALVESKINLKADLEKSLDKARQELFDLTGSRYGK